MLRSSNTKTMSVNTNSVALFVILIGLLCMGFMSIVSNANVDKLLSSKASLNVTNDGVELNTSNETDSSETNSSESDHVFGFNYSLLSCNNYHVDTLDKKELWSSNGTYTNFFEHLPLVYTRHDYEYGNEHTIASDDGKRYIGLSKTTLVERDFDELGLQNTFDWKIFQVIDPVRIERDSKEPLSVVWTETRLYLSSMLDNDFGNNDYDLDELVLIRYKPVHEDDPTTQTSYLDQKVECRYPLGIYYHAKSGKLVYKPPSVDLDQLQTILNIDWNFINDPSKLASQMITVIQNNATRQKAWNAYVAFIINVMVEQALTDKDTNVDKLLENKMIKQANNSLLKADLYLIRICLKNYVRGNRLDIDFI